MTKILYTSRTPVQQFQRCPRLRWLGNYEGPTGMGLEPKKKSVHLVVGSAVHAGMEVLLRCGQQALDEEPAERTLGEKLVSIFERPNVFDLKGLDYKEPVTLARHIENRAVAAALADMRTEMADAGGEVELDPEEEAARQAARLARGEAGGVGGAQTAGGIEIDFAGLVPGQTQTAAAAANLQQDSPIVIDFVGMEPTDPVLGIPVSSLPGALPAPSQCQTGEDYLVEELASLIEGMVRAWSRRRWRGVLEQFEVLEVEKEGEWKLGEVELAQENWSWKCIDCAHVATEPEIREGIRYCSSCHIGVVRGLNKAELHFLSRHDALLLERSTGYLYLQSFKTTGSWDRRKELDAQVDMQGLSEAVDVERRFGEAWELVRRMNRMEVDVCANCGHVHLLDDEDVEEDDDYPQAIPAEEDGNRTDTCDEGGCGCLHYSRPDLRIKELVSERTADWLRSLPDPPTILGVRYEYLLKGSRRKDTKDMLNPDRYVQDSILCRAWKQEGITAEDRRWAWSYDWMDETGKSRRLDYRSWQKAPVWKSMPIVDWIDLLDQGKVQEGALGENGEPMDALAGVFVPVVVTYRAADEMRDLLEQMESQEVQVAKDVEEVRRAEREEGVGGKRSALNRLFPQNRQACSYPGLCPYRSTATSPGFCFGGPDALEDPGVLERFAERIPNHPAEGLVRISEGQ